MKAGVIFTGSGPILILTTYPDLVDPQLAAKLKLKGIVKYLAFEVSTDLCAKRYGDKYHDIARDLTESADMRILDYNGHNIFQQFHFQELGPLEAHEPEQ
jgi:hypothetical protein